MICLAVQTANSELSIALRRETGEVLYVFKSPETRDQGNLIFNHIAEGLAKNGIGYGDLGLLAVVTGPGSFTGIRIGIAAARGLALAAALPCIGVDSFDLFHVAMPGRKTLVVLESWRAELYARLDGEDPVNLTPQDIYKRYAGAGGLCITGDAAHKMAALFPDAVYPAQGRDAADLVAMAFRIYRDNPASSKPAPFYLRDADVTMPKPLVQGA
jgi:tRNA threonylcarbamoyladenosine biosynthesis protein TsaB